MPPGPEAQLQNRVVHLARVGGWLVMHTRPAQMRSGRWSTPLQGTPGFPDLVLVHPGRQLTLFVELKSDREHPRPEQVRWIDALRAAGQTVHVWRPRDWPTIVATLTPNAVAAGCA